MTNKHYLTVSSILADIEGFITEKLSHVASNLVQTQEEKEVAHQLRSEMITEILAISQKHGLKNKTVGEICGVARGLVYYMKKRMYNHLSTEKCATVLKHLMAFDKDAQRHNLDSCIVHYMFMRREEKFEVPEIHIKTAALEEITILLTNLKLSPKAFDQLVKGYRGSVESVKTNNLSNISVKRILELLAHLRGLSKDGYQSESFIRTSTKEREVIYERIENLMCQKKLSAIDLQTHAICHKRNIYYIHARDYQKVSHKKAKRILEKLETFTSTL